MIVTNGRIIYEHLLHFFPRGEDVYFVAYHKKRDTFLNGQKEWIDTFEPECIFQHEVEDVGFPKDLIIMADFLNHLFAINKLDVFALFQYTMKFDQIEYDYALIDGQRDYLTLLEMLSETNE